MENEDLADLVREALSNIYIKEMDSTGYLVETVRCIPLAHLLALAQAVGIMDADWMPDWAKLP